MTASDRKSPAVTEINSSKTVRLTDGEYQILPLGENIDGSAITAVISEKTKQIKIEPAFSDEYLRILLARDKTTIHQIISSRYPEIISKFIIDDGELTLDGTWYNTTLRRTPPVSEADFTDSDSHRVILHKLNNEWQIAAEPSLVFKYNDYPSIPRIVVNKANLYSAN